MAQIVDRSAPKSDNFLDLRDATNHHPIRSLRIFGCLKKTGITITQIKPSAIGRDP